jgi:hypothetical protein
VAGSCEHDNELSGSINGWEFPEQQRDYRLFKMDSVLWSQLFCEWIGNEIKFAGQLSMYTDTCTKQ